MRAIVADPGAAALAMRQDPPTGADEVLLRPRRVLLLAADHALPSRRRGFLGVPGACVMGVVERPTNAQADLPKGMRVVIDPVLPCGRCVHCRSGLAAVCPDRTIAGLRGRDGGLAELMALPAANLLALPDSIDDDRAAFALPIGTAATLERRLGLREEDLVTVLGDGAAALLAAAVMRTRLPRTRLLSDDPATARVAAQWSLPHRPLDDAGRRHDQDAVVLAEVSPRLLDAAAGMLRPRGQLAAMTDGVEPWNAGVLASLRRLEATVVLAGLGRVSDGLAILRRRAIDPLALLRRRASLEEAVGLLLGPASELDGTLVQIGHEPRVAAARP